MASPLKPRRLFELLEEQQEPFLLKNGYSKRSFKSQYPFRCWRLNTHGPRRRACFLNGLYIKLVYWKFIKKALNWESLKLGDCFSEVRRETNAADFHRLSSSSVELSGDIGWKAMEHSPVSVLELHYDEGSSDHNHCKFLLGKIKYNGNKKAMEEENASTFRLNSPTMSVPVHLESKGELHQPRQLLLDYLKEMEDKCCNPSEFLGQRMGCNIMGDDTFPWEKQRGDFQIFTEFLSLDLSATQERWTQYQDEKREIEKVIGGKIFEELREECVFDMLGLGFHCTLET